MTGGDSHRLQRSGSLASVTVGDSVVIYDPQTQTAHILNPTAAAILEAFAVPAALDDVVSSLADRFGMSAGSIQADVASTVEELAQLRLIADPTDDGDPTNAAAIEDPIEGDAGQPVECFEALGWCFSIRCDAEPIGSFLRDRLATLAVKGHPTATYLVEARGDAFRATCTTGDFDASGSQAALAGEILWHLNHTAIEHCRSATLLHAGGVVAAHGVIGFPAPSNNGKSTLIAGLVREGFRYVTDEALAIDTATGSIWPYPKPIGIDPGSFPLFPEAAPDPYDPDTLMTSRWWVPPAALTDQRPIAADAASPLPLCAIIFPVFAPDGPTDLREMDAPDALMELLQNAFNMRRVGQVGLDRLAAVATTVPCFNLQVADLPSGIAAVRRVVART